MTAKPDDDRHQNSSPHSDLEFDCPATLDQTEEVMMIDRESGEKRPVEQPKRCRATITYDDHYVGMSSHTEARKQGYEGKALKFRCPDCGEITLLCPVCADSNTPGWYRGESTGEMLACHNCNHEEYVQQNSHSGVR